MSERDSQSEGARPQRRLRVLDEAAVAALLSNPDGYYVYENQAAASLLGYEPAELLRIHISQLEATDLEWVRDQLERLRVRRFWSGRVILRRRTGDTLAVLANFLVAPGLDARESYLALLHPVAESEPPPAVKGEPEAFGLHGRDVHVLILASEGFTEEEVALLLDMTPSEVSGYMRTVRQAMGSSSSTEACIRAIKAGLIV